jgi:hypothetical protein
VVTPPAVAYHPGSDLGQPEEVALSLPDTGVLHAYLWWASKTTDASMLYHLGAILPALAHEAARRGVYIASAYERPPRIWTCLVGGSGSRKSTAVARSKDFVREFYTSILGGQYVDPYMQLAGSSAGMFHRISMTRWDDHRGHHRCILDADEFTAILGVKHSDINEFLIQLWNGDDRIERHTRELQKLLAEMSKAGNKFSGPNDGSTIVRSAISAVFATTPISLAAVASNQHVSGGLFARILWIRAKLTADQVVDWPEPYAAQMERVIALDEWKKWCGAIDALEMLNGGAPLVITFPYAVREFIVENAVRPFNEVVYDDNNKASGAASRVGEMVRTISGLYAFSRGALDVSEDDAKRAINLVRQCFSTFDTQVSRVVDVSPEQRLATGIENLIREAGEGGVCKSRILRTFNAQKRIVDPILETLEESEKIRRFVPQRSGPGRRGVVYTWAATKGAS